MLIGCLLVSKEQKSITGFPPFFPAPGAPLRFLFLRYISFLSKSHLFLISASLWNLIVFLIVFPTLYGHHQQHLASKVMLVARVILSTKTKAWKMLFIRFQLSYLPGFCHCCMIQRSKWFKLAINNSYLEFTGSFIYFLLNQMLCHCSTLSFQCECFFFENLHSVEFSFHKCTSFDRIG